MVPLDVVAQALVEDFESSRAFSPLMMFMPGTTLFPNPRVVTYQAPSSVCVAPLATMPS
jgi:hypothetical protein